MTTRCVYFPGVGPYINGEVAAYDVIESSEDGYVSTASVRKIDANSYEILLENSQESTSVEVSKTWTGLIGSLLTTGLPDSISLQLQRVDGENIFNVGGEVTVVPDDQGNWTYTFENLAKFYNGQLAKYTVKEIPVVGFTSTVSEPRVTENGTFISLENSQETVQLTVNKLWEDIAGDPLTENLPDSIQLQLVRETSQGAEEIGEPVTVLKNEAGEWTYTFENLPKVHDGLLAKYKVEEIVPEGFAVSSDLPRSTVDGFEQTLTNKSESTSVKVVKSWAGIAGSDIVDELPESIYVQLVRIVNETEIEVSEWAEISANDQGDWIHAFTNLPKYVDGQLAVYSVKERGVDGFVGTASTSVQDEFTVVNLSNSAETTWLEVEKQWVDVDDNPLESELPESIQLQLVRVTDDGQETVGAPVTVTPTAEGEWNYVFDNLAKYVGREEAVYSVIEIPLPGFESTVTETETTAGGQKVAVTNKNAPTEVNVEKVWQNETGEVITEGVPDSIEIQLLEVTASGEVEVGEPVTVSRDNDGNYRYTFSNLPQTREGQAIEYTVKETPVLGYISTVEKLSDDDSGWADIRIINRAEVTSLAVNKEWLNSDGTPLSEPGVDSIRIQLIHVVGTQRTRIGDPVEVVPNDQGDWTYTFSNLPRMIDGNQANYTVEEIPVPGFTSAVESELTVTGWKITLTNKKDVPPTVTTPPTITPVESTEPSTVRTSEPSSSRVTSTTTRTTSQQVVPNRTSVRSSTTPTQTQAPVNRMANTGAAVIGIIALALLLMIIGLVLVIRRNTGADEL